MGESWEVALSSLANLMLPVHEPGTLCMAPAVLERVLSSLLILRGPETTQGRNHWLPPSLLPTPVLGCVCDDSVSSVPSRGSAELWLESPRG